MKPSDILTGWRYALAKVILLLEWLPAYRRFYTWNNARQVMEDPRWYFCRPGRGMWGINLLNRLAWFWPLTNRWIANDDDWTRNED